MTRLIALVAIGVALAAGALVGMADDPPKKLTPDERKKLATEAREITDVGLKQYRTGELAEAEKSFKKALDVTRRLFPKEEFPNGLKNLANCLNNLAVSIKNQARPADAEPLYREVLGIRRRMFNGDHPDTATTLNSLAHMLAVQGPQKLPEAADLLREAVAMRRQLFMGDHPSTAESLSNLGLVIHHQGNLPEAANRHREALEMRRRLFKADHRDTAASLNNLALVQTDLGNVAEAEELHREALGMRRRLFPGDHPDTAGSLNNLAGRLNDRGKLADAEPLYWEALEMRRRLFKGDHPDTAGSLNNLGSLLRSQGDLPGAKKLLREALGMWQRLFKGDYPDTAICLSNLATVLADLGEPAEAEDLHSRALEMTRRLFKGDHPQMVTSLINRAYRLGAQGKPAEAEPLFLEALAMSKRMYKGDHSATAAALTDLALALALQGKLDDAETLFRDALTMDKRLIEAYAGRNSEGDALTLLAHQAQARDAYLTVAQAQKTNPAAVYAEVFSSKGSVARVFERRHLAARAAATDPKAAKLLFDLAEARRRRADLLLAPDDPATRKNRDDNLKSLADTVAGLDRDLRPLLPAVERGKKLATATPADLQKVLPPDTVVVDFLRFLSWDPNMGVKAGGKVAESYVAFIVTPSKLTWVDLGPAKQIENAVTAWREAITSGQVIPPALPAKVRELVWAKVRKEIPAAAKVVYVAPDLALCRVPWAALPGDNANTILLDDYTIALVPHAAFLLDRLWPQDPSPTRSAGVLVVSGVAYDANPPAPESLAVNSRDLPVKLGQRVGWPVLHGAAAEGNGVVGAAERKKLNAHKLGAEKATPAAVLMALPKARYAHFATHGFFADPSFRSAFHLDPKLFEKTLRGDRVGAGALSPLVMTGLVFAGANHPTTPGRGVLTGEALVDLDLSGLDLVVLSACETGIGDVAGGEGTFGIQRAFHLAGTRDVVASLWKIPDRATAALMSLFYRNLWEKDMRPAEAVRQAQLDIYRHPAKIAELATQFRGKFKEVPGTEDSVANTDTDGRAHPRLWAAFTLSGLGR